jgi:hypothetical protein
LGWSKFNKTQKPQTLIISFGSAILFLANSTLCRFKTCSDYSFLFVLLTVSASIQASFFLSALPPLNKGAIDFSKHKRAKQNKILAKKKE